MPVIGSLNILSLATVPRFVAAFHQGLGEAGFVDGRELVDRIPLGRGPIPSTAGDGRGILIKRQVAAIFAVGPPAVSAAKSATATIPIVFLSGLDPVKAGYVASLSRPGGNLTGVSLVAASFGPKRFELLREMVPAARIQALLVNPTNPNVETQVSDIRALAASIGRECDRGRQRQQRRLRSTPASRRSPSSGSTPSSSAPIRSSSASATGWSRWRRATRFRAIYDWREYAFAGGLMSYGTSLPDAYREAALYVGRILKGAKPAELPVVQPAKYELVVDT